MTTATAVQTKLTIDRKSLVKALEKINRIISRVSKPILQCVRMEATDNKLWLAGTDLDLSLTVHVPAEGELPRCIVPCKELLQRIKTGSNPICSIWQEDEHLIVNGGSTHHRLLTQPVAEYPLIPLQPEGRVLTLPAGSFRESLQTALVGVARENTRYAINGVLLEVKSGKMHLVAADGRRMVVIELGTPDEPQDLAVILPARLCQMIVRLTDQYEPGTLKLHVKENQDTKGEKTPSSLFVVGNGWVLHGMEIDGHFPCWRDVVPKNESKFMLDRQAFLTTVREVSTACASYSPGVQVRLAADQTTVTAKSAENGESSGQVTSRFLGGGDSLILTGFNPQFLEDVLKTLTGKNVLIEVKQNTPATNGDIHQYPAVFYDWADRRVKWVVMPVGIHAKASPESLGSNYRDTPGAAA
jgi:DNA polymerase-3 subunit beta